MAHKEYATVTADQLFIVALVGQGVILLTAVLTYLKASQTSKAVGETHLLVNKRMDDLLETTRAIAHAEGVKDTEDKNRALDD